MLQKKSSLTLSAAVITVLASSSYATLATDLPPPTETLRKGVGLPEKKRPSAHDSWIKNPQKTASQEAAEKQRAERDAELAAIRQAKQDPASEVTSAATEKKPAEAPKHVPSPKRETPSPAPVPTEKPASKTPRTIQEQIQINMQEKLLRSQQMNKGKAEAEPAKQAETPDQNTIRMGRSQRELMRKLGMTEKEKSAAQPATPPAPLPKPTPAQRPAALEEAKSGIPTPPPLPSGGEPKTPHKNTIAMSPSQRKLMDKLGIREEEKPAASEETKDGIPTPPPPPASAAPGTGEKPTSSRSSLLEEIRKGKQLKHVDAPQR